MSRPLLSEIAHTIGRRRAEDVATAALRHLTATKPRLGAALTRHLSDVVGTDLDVVTYEAQVTAVDQGRADLVGRAADGRETVIVEAKINAGVHGAQIATYLERLAPHGGQLVLLAPVRRLAFVRREAERQAEAVEDGRGRLFATSWEAVVHVLEAAVVDDPQADWELRQVAALYREIEGEQLVVLDPADVAPDAARSMWSIYRMVDSALDHELMASAADVEFSSRRRSGQSWGYGGGGTAHGREVWFGCWLSRWVQKGGTPYWMHVNLSPGLPAAVTSILQADAGDRPVAYVRDGHDQVEIPVYVPAAESPEQQTELLARAILESLHAVNMAVEQVRPRQPGAQENQA